eukprot:scaffold23925_cov157-Cylindrotheca_fusiformis.AAC.5
MSQGSKDSFQDLLPVDVDSSEATAHVFAGPIPRTAPEPDVADSLISRAMAACSIKVLEEAYDDIHGTAQAVEETPSFVEKSLEELELQIRMRKDSEAYLLAKEMDSSYVENPEFRLMFLRTDRFNVKAAALRIVRHFQAKLDLFGKEALARDITQDDLDKETMGSLYQGLVRILRTPDRSGRAVALWIVDGTHAQLSLNAKLRRTFYSAMVAAASSPETQKRGLVGVIYFLKKPQPSFPAASGGLSVEAMWKHPKSMENLPIHVAAMHFCNDSGAWSPMQTLIKLTLNVFTRIRIRSHCGSFDEIRAGLQSYGIQPSSFPVELGGEETREKQRQWLEGQRRIERQTKPPRDRILVPFRFDVLFGKGSGVQNHFGNVKLRELIADCMKTYEKTDVGEKYLVVQAIVNTVKQSSGRFLKPDDDSWIVVDDAAAEKKVAAQFRTRRTLNKNGANNDL